MEKISKQHHVHKLDAAMLPCISANSGSRLVFEVWDALEGNGRQEYDPTEPADQRMARANPATGPVYINGAMPGDVLEVEINKIIPVGAGYLHLRKSLVAPDETRTKPVYAEFEFRDNELLYNGSALPAYPMIGVIGTAPVKEAWTQENGDHGGNMDTSIIKQGAKVLLPVFVEGALLVMGDVHAAMGDGEILGQGIEIGADIEVTVGVRKDLSLERPVVIDNEKISCIASGDDMEDLSYTATRDMGNFLFQTENLSWEEAALLVGLYGDLKICQLVNPKKTVRMELMRKHAAIFQHK